ncbi:MAG: hypothetical protein JXQ96_07035 [Cyclobacteriaceae bacterium]
MPDQGKMHCNVVVKEEGKRDVFALTVPETIACRDTLLLNFPETNIQWEDPDEFGVVKTSWIKEGVIYYDLEITPNYDFVDVKMTIRNLSQNNWQDVWSFNCLNPVRAEDYKDSLMHRTYMSTTDGPKLLSETERRIGRVKTIGLYFNEGISDPNHYAFTKEFDAISPDRTNGNYLVTLSQEKDSYMAATSQDALFLFNNLKFKCIHSAPNFGDISPNESKTVNCRFYFAKGNLNDFLNRIE